jgi:pyridoxal/pyridoxine/pyridoxamine kinase
MQQVKIISVSSFAAHKTASLKAQIAVLGSAILPVPTIVLNGVASFSNVVKQTIDFMPILEATLQLSLLQKQKVYLFIGYIIQPEDILKFVEFINKYRHDIAGLIVDPISGDNDQPYIDKKTIGLWPHLIALADFAFPNLTEIKLYSGLPAEEKSVTRHIEAFERQFPKLDYVVTSYSDGKKYGVLLKCGLEHLFIKHKYYNNKIDGTGDVFAAYYLKYYLFENNHHIQSCKKALRNMLNMIQKSIKNDLAELEI